jgi:hypothetical protein
MLPWEMLEAIGAQFWERLAMPFFLIIMGFNMSHSFKHKGVTKLRDLYSRDYFWKKTKRYVLPFILTYLISILLGIYFDALEFSEEWYLLWLPFWGPGNWFILVLFTSILVFPLTYKLYTIKPKLTVALCVLSEILIGLILFFTAPLIQYGTEFYVIPEARDLMWLLRLNILIYLSAVGLGLWFSDGHDIKEKRNLWLWITAPLSFIYVYAFHFYDFRFQIFDGEYYHRIFWGDYTILIYPYAAFLILLAMRFIPSESKSRIANLFSKISKSTYHILLCQILYYAVWFHLNPEFVIIGFGSDVYLFIPFYIFTVFVCFSCGMLWFEAERRMSVAIQKRREKTHQELVTSNR